MKLYFLTGLPTETDDDTLGIAELAKNCAAIGRRHTSRASVTVSLGGFVPKPHTPFQWFGQNTEAELRRKVNLVRTALHKTPGVTLKWHDPRATVAEGIASRGDRRIGRVIERVWRSGGTFQEWGESFDLDRWTDAMAAEGLSLDWYVHRHRTFDEVLPWQHLTAGLHADFLWDDWQSALAGSGVEDCRWTPCYDCGVCTGYGIEHVVASTVPPAGGSQGTGQDLSRGGEVPVTLLTDRTVVAGAGSHAWRELRHEVADPLHQARQGPLREPPRRRPHLGDGRCARSGCRPRTAPDTPPVPRSASAWRCRPAPSRSPSTSTSSSAKVPRRTSMCSVPNSPTTSVPDSPTRCPTAST